MNKPPLFDTHTHFNDDLYSQRSEPIEDILAESRAAGVQYFCNVGFSLASSQLAIQQAEVNEGVYVAIGVHPNEVDKHSWEDLGILSNLESQKIVAIGEVGLDYYYTKETKALQKEWFKRQIDLAAQRNLTLMMHIRDEKDVYGAYDDVIEILKNCPLQPSRMIVHCFSADALYAQKFLDLGCYINIGGAVTFKNAKTLQEAVKLIPLNRLLLETDAPYLTPHPHRGQVNYCKLLPLTVEKIAELKGLIYEDVATKTTQNALTVFNLN